MLPNANGHSMEGEYTVDSTDEFNQLVDQNGLVKLFANRVRARVLVTLAYADEPLTHKEIAHGANIHQTVTIEALEAMEPFDIIESLEGEEKTRYRLADDELVEAIIDLARLATDRFYRRSRPSASGIDPEAVHDR